QKMRPSNERARRPGEFHVDAERRRLEAFAVCVNPGCGYYAAFADLRDSPPACPRCGRPLQKECAACGMLLRSAAPTCQNCGRLIGPLGS
ncbi:MAG: hypothetical protein ACRDIC_17805, partial [bacterium]